MTHEETIKEEIEQLRKWPEKIPPHLHMEAVFQFMYEELRKLREACARNGIIS